MKFGKTRLGSKLLEKRIPTLIGMGVLVISLIAGVLLFSQGTGVFAPRAAPETTPKKVRITNVTDSSFTISFYTDNPTAGYVLYGTSESNVKRNRANDDRLQLSGDSDAKYTLSHVTVRGLEENTTYYYLLGTNSSTFDNNGKPFTVSTGKRSGAPTAAKTVHGSVSTEAGGPADGAIVYVALEGAGPLSSLVKSSGSWAIPLSNARKTDGSGYATINDSGTLSLTVQGVKPDQQLAFSLLISEAQPVPGLTFGQEPTLTPSKPLAAPDGEELDVTQLEGEDELSVPLRQGPAAPGQLSGLIGDGPGGDGLAITIVDMTNEDHQEVQTTQPTITGTVAPEIEVTITVNSETQIIQTVTSDASGNFTLDLASLGKDLEPGEHTATYSYTDPATGQVVTRTVSFTVSDPMLQLAQAEPYGSGNPYPAQTSSPTPSATPSPTPDPTPDATESASKGDIATRSAMPSTESAIPVSGSVGTTLALVFGGLFFIISGVWSYWIATQFNKNEIDW
jgi:hypothetical protein